MAMAYKQNTTCGVRSISFPTPSHPTTYQFEKEVNDVKTLVLSSCLPSCKPSTEAVCDSLYKLSPLYERIQELINFLPSLQNEHWVEELMDGLVGFLDVCGIIRHIVSEHKEQVIVLECALRRRKGASTLESSIAQYKSFRKKITKDVKRLIVSLNQSMGAKLDECHHHHHNEVVTKTVKEVMDVTVTIFETLLNHLVTADSRTPTANKWSTVVSKLIQKTRVICEEHHHRQQEQHWRINCDLEGLDVACSIRYNKDGLPSWSYGKGPLERMVKGPLERMEAQLERMEDSLERIYMTLIRTRASLLNIVSHY